MIVLAVDDEKLALEALSEAIAQADAGAVVHAFRHASEAIRFAEENTCDVAFLDIEMREMRGIDLAKKLKGIQPQLNIVFATGYDNYRGDAFDLHVSGYIMKPITADKVRIELDNLRHPLEPVAKNRVRFQTFGNFEVFIDNAPLHFKYEKTKELLAYLVDRRGALCSGAEIMTVLWEDEGHESYFRNIRKDLTDTLTQKDCGDILFQQWKNLGINKDKVDCDLYDYLDGVPQAMNAYKGEYMIQYSWAEETYGDLEDL